MLIPTAQNVKTITDMREDALGLLRAAKNSGFVYLFHRSDPQAVLVSVDEFQRLQEMSDDYMDVIEAEQVLQNRKIKYTPLKKFWKKYGLTS